VVDGSFVARRETAAAIAGSDAIAILTGSYDGSGNYGDIAQLDAALGLFARSGRDVLVLPVIERQFADTHESMAAAFLHRPAHVLYFDGGGDPGGEGLVPVDPPGNVGLAISYLYGGGFLNPDWGERKLAMLRSVEDLLGAGTLIRFSSGLQVDGEWIGDLDPADTELLRGFQLLAGRDDSSVAALAELGGVETTNSGDDAVGVLPSRATAYVLPSGAEPLEVNVHIAEHEWVTDRPDSVREFVVGLLSELSRLAGRRVRVRPLLAYLDPRIDERPGLDRFAASCAELDLELAEPQVLRPTNGGELGGAALTVSCSYHVALTSMLMGIPTVLLRDNDYYEQKAGGLLSDFGLAEAFSPRSSDDPVQIAGAIAPHLFDAEQAEETRRELRSAAGRIRQRRAEMESRLQSLITGGPTHRITDLRRGPGELSFEVRIAGEEPRRLWIRSSTEFDPNADAALAACVMPAMRRGGTLTLEEPVSPRLLRNQREYQSIQRAWSHGWEWGDPPLREVEVIAAARDPEPSTPTGRVAAFFSGGVDSFATILGNPEVTDLIFVRGVDILPRLTHQDGLADEVEAKLKVAAAELGLPLHVVEINFRDLSEPLVRWEYYSACPLAAIALFFQPLFDRVLIAGDTDHETQPPLGSARLVDQLWSTERVEIVDDGGRFNREQRLRQIAEHPIVQRTLRVCWENPEAAYNCGRCRKCMLTTIPLAAIGALEKFETFPPDLDLDLLSGFEVATPIALTLWEDVLATVEEEGRDDIATALEPMVARGRLTLGLPSWHRNRRRGAPQAPTGVELEESREELQRLLTSRSWHLTAPLRRLGDAVRARRRRR
jgi:hypothetical protein